MPQQIWYPFRLKKPAEMNETIVHLHHAVQFLAMFTNSYRSKAPDDSHTNLGWDGSRNKIVSRESGQNSIRLSLAIHSFELSVERNPSSSIVVSGHTRDEIEKFILEEIAREHFDKEQFGPITQYSLPHHDLLSGGRFLHPDPTLTSEWCYYLSNTQRLLSEMSSLVNDSTEIRIWPHHFDLAMLIVLARDADHNPSTTIGLGLAMPDNLYPEPYWYVNLWSQKRVQFSQKKPLTSAGDWRKNGYNGITLPATRVVKGSNQQQLLEAFLWEGMQVMCDEAGEPSPVNKSTKSTVS